MIQRLWPIILKEYRQIKRDKRVLGILIFIPAFMLLINGFAMNFDVQNITLAVVDQDNSQTSRDFLLSFTNSSYFREKFRIESAQGGIKLIDEAKVKAVIVIPPDFSRKLQANEIAPVQVLVDGMESNAATTIIGYTQAISMQYSQKILLSNLVRMGRNQYIPISVEARIWYNPELKSAKFLVPGLIGFILTITGIIATSLSIVKEKERNTIEQIYVSPIHPFELIVGKLIPYAVISLLAATLVLCVAYFLFDVVIKGNYFLLFCTTTLFIVTALSIGFFVSTISDSQQVAFQLSALISMLPTMVLSGFIFPIDSMPWWLKILTNITPNKFFLVILRSIILKGVGLSAIWDQILYLMIFTSVVLMISIRRFNRASR